VGWFGEVESIGYLTYRFVGEQKFVFDFCQQVLNSLLDKYADQGVCEIETKEALKVAPFTELGRPLELAKKGFGGPKQFEQAITELEEEIYRQPQRA
jgi:type I restriction enzyme R subunit